MSEFQITRNKAQRKLLDQIERTNRELRPLVERGVTFFYALDEEAAYLEEEIREFNKQYPDNPYDFGDSGY